MTATTTSSSSAAAPAAARWRARWPARAPASSSSSAAAACRRKHENWSPEAVWKHLRYRAHEQWLDADGPGVPAVHALRRRRQHEVLGQRALPAAPRGLPGRRARSTASRRRGRSTTTRWRRTTTAPSGSITCTASTGVDPTEPARGPFPYAPIPHSRGMAEIVDGAAQRSGLHPSPLPLGLIRPGEEGGCQLCNTCNSFPCRIHAKSDAEVCGIRPALAHAQRRAVDQHLGRRLLTDRRVAASKRSK